MKLAFLKKFKHLKKGFSLVLVAMTIPVILLGIDYAIKKIENTSRNVSAFEVPSIVAVTVANHFNPGKSWADQEEYLYSLAAQAYNDRFYFVNKDMAFRSPGSITVYKTRYSGVVMSNPVELYNTFSTYAMDNILMTPDMVPRRAITLNADPMLQDKDPYSDFVFSNETKTLNYSGYHKVRGASGIEAYSVSTYAKDETKLKLSYNGDTHQISCECPRLKMSATANVPNCDVDIVIGIPTNYASCNTSNSKTADVDDLSTSSNMKRTPLRQIANACQVFLKNFLHIAGVSVGIVPYSGKLSLPLGRENWTTKIPMTVRDNTKLSPEPGADLPYDHSGIGQPNIPYITQSMFYGSDGKFGGELMVNADEPDFGYGDYVNWGRLDYGCPIMSRLGQPETYRNMTLYSGMKNSSESLLLNMESPLTSIEYRFIQMNLNPCYLGYCNTLAMLCEHDCPTYMANPYFITELTADLPGVIYDLGLLNPFVDKKNKSNFLFLPVLWAGNLFSNWAQHPSDDDSYVGTTETPRNNKKRIVIIIANAPDNFEPVELTYLGFNNDHSEIPMYESDTILFDLDGFHKQGSDYLGVKGALCYSPISGATVLSSGREKPTEATYIVEDAESEYPEYDRGLKYPSGGKAKISFPNKGVIKVVIARDEPANVVFYGDNGVTDNLEGGIEKNGVLSKRHYFTGQKTYTFSGPQQVYNFTDQVTKFQPGNYTTGGPNFGHNLSVKKLKFKAVRCVLSTADLKGQILRYYGKYDSSECGSKNIILNDNGNVNRKCDALGKRMDPCIEANHHYDTADGWTSDGTYIKAYNFHPFCYGVTSVENFIMAADNFPAEKLLVDEGYNCKAAVNHTSSTDDPWYEIGYIYYNTGGGTKYRIYNVADYPANNSDNCVRIFTGRMHYWSTVSYFDFFASKKHRERDVTQKITTEKLHKNICTTSTNKKTGESTSCAHMCCQKSPYYITRYRDCEKYKCTARNDKGVCTDGYYYTCARCCSYKVYFTNSSGEPKFEYSVGNTTSDTNRCVGIIWNEQGYPNETNDWRIDDVTIPTITCEPVTDSPWGTETEEYPSYDANESPYYYYKPTSTFTTTFRKTQKQDSKSCKFDEASDDNGCCDEYTPSVDYDFAGSKKYRRKACVYDRDNATESCGSLSYSTDKLSYDTTGSWQYTTTEKKRLYAKKTVTSSGTVTSTSYKLCDAGQDGDGNPLNCYDVTKSDYVKKESLYPNGSFDEKQSIPSMYRYNLHNFFFVSGADDKTATFTYNANRELIGGDKGGKITSFSDSNLLKNQGIYLYQDSKDDSSITYWLCFCGDGNLSLTFAAQELVNVKFDHIRNSKYRISLDNKVVTNTVGTEVTTFDNKHSFYILPEQIMDDKDADGNYYFNVNLSENTRVVSVEVNNRVYTTVKPTAKLANGAIKHYADNTAKKDVEFVTNLKTSFEFEALSPYFWTSGKTDFRQTSGSVKILGNTNEVQVKVRGTVPDAGTGMYLTDNTYAVTSNDGTASSKPKYRYIIYTDRKLRKVELPGYRIPSVQLTAEGLSDGAKTNRYWTRKTLDAGNEKTVSISSSHFNHGGNIIANAQTKPIWDNGVNPIYPDPADSNFKRASYKIESCDLKKISLEKLDVRFGTQDSKVYNDIYTTVYSKAEMVASGKNESTGHFDFLDNDIYFRGTYPGIRVTMPTVVGTYGKGSVGVRLKHRSGAPSMAGRIGPESGDATQFAATNEGTYTRSYSCSSSACVRVVVGETNEASDKNSLYYVSYQKFSPFVLKSGSTTAKHDGRNMVDTYTNKSLISGDVRVHGTGTLNFLVQPKKVKDTLNPDLSSVNPKGSFGAYSYQIESDEIFPTVYSKANKANYVEEVNYWRTYVGGQIGYTYPSDGSYGIHETYTTSTTNYLIFYPCYTTSVAAENVIVSLDEAKEPGYVGNTMVRSGKSRNSKTKFIVSPTDPNYKFELQNDGLYHIKIPCRNVYISNVKPVDPDPVRVYAHPDITKEKLRRTRIIDGYDQGKNKGTKTYGEVSYDRKTLGSTSVTAIQKLFYYIKDDRGNAYVYPYKSSSSNSEKGDFFIHLWDQNDEIPAIKWQLNSSIRSGDFTDEFFGNYRSNYSFAGLHRMFFPYGVYGDNYAGFGEALNSALVFTGYTLPINYMLLNAGYQEVSPADAVSPTSYTNPNAAIEKLAQDACTKLKSLSTSKGAPIVHLIKYRTSATLSLESCADYKYSVSSESNLADVLTAIAQQIKIDYQNNDLSVSVKNDSPTTAKKTQ